MRGTSDSRGFGRCLEALEFYCGTSELSASEANFPQKHKLKVFVERGDAAEQVS